MKKTIYILDAIYPQGWGGVSLASVKSQMSGMKPSDELEVVINSPGGSVFEGIAIFNFLRDYNPTVRIIGVAASIASIIAMAGKKIIMAPAATFMVHEPWTFSIGDEDYMAQVATQLNSLKRAMVEAYQIRMPEKSEKDILDWLKDEKYITGKEAKSLGLADEYNADPKEADFSMKAMMKFAALMNKDNTPTKENKTTTINNEVPVMVTQEQFDTLQNEFNDKVIQINTLNSKVSDLETTNKDLEKELKASKNEVLVAKMDSYKAEETLFVDKLIEDKKIEANQKDFIVDDLVAKRLDTKKEAYSSMRTFLDSKAVNPLTKAQATKERAGEAEGGPLNISDFNDEEKADQILAIVNKRAKEDNISFADALELVQSEASEKGGE